MNLILPVVLTLAVLVAWWYYEQMLAVGGRIVDGIVSFLTHTAVRQDSLGDFGLNRVLIAALILRAPFVAALAVIWLWIA